MLTNSIPPAQDQANYLGASEILHQSVKSGNALEFFEQVNEVLRRRPPLIAIMPIPFYLILGSSHDSALLVNLFFLIIFMFFFYLLVQKLYTRNIAFFAAIAVTLMPLFYGLLRQFFVEFGLMTLVVVWLYVLLKTEYFSKSKYLILLGIVSGLGMLMKFHFFVFIAGPLLFYFLVSLRKKKVQLRDIRRLALFITPAIVLTLPWYSKNILIVLWHAKRATNPGLLGDYYYGPFYSLGVLTRSLFDLVNFSISGYWSLMIAILFFISIFFGKKIKINFFVLSWFLIPFLIFFFGPNKDYRLMLPILPAFGIFISVLFWKTAGKLGFFLFPIIFLVPLLLYINTTLLPENFSLGKYSFGPLLILDDRVGNYVLKANRGEWPISQIILFLDNLEPINEAKTVTLASENSELNINNLIYFATLEKVPIQFKTVSYLPKNSNFSDVESEITDSDYLIIKSGGVKGALQLNRLNETIINNLKWSKVPNNFLFPDGGKLLIFKNNSQ